MQRSKLAALSICQGRKKSQSSITTSDNVHVPNPQPGLLPPKEVVAAQVAHAVARRADLAHLVGVVCRGGRRGDGEGEQSEEKA